MHTAGFIHRDLKPPSVLLSRDGTVKLADFGHSAAIRPIPDAMYIVSRWYWAPELVLTMPDYGVAVDVWAAATVIAELYTAAPLFPGNSDVDQLWKICSMINAPSAAEWGAGHAKAKELGWQFPFPSRSGHTLQELLSLASPDALDLLQGMLRMNPAHRLSCKECLAHPFFSSSSQTCPCE